MPGSGRRRGGAARARVRAALAIAALAVSLPAARLAAQDPVPPPGDTLVGVLPDSVRGILGEPGAREEAQRFPARLGAPRGPSHEVFRCDRACVHASTALSLLELLVDRVPGLAPTRGSFFAGPHYAMDGLFGAGFVSFYVDGREIPSLAGAQTDLRRLSLNYVDQIRVYRGPDGFVVDIDLIRHDASRAYSRISGGTGEPSLQILDGVFANGLGSAFNVEGAFELLDVNAGGTENDRFGAFGRLSWMPWSNDFGIQLEFGTASVDRAAADTADVRRREIVLRSRANLGERAQFEVYGASSTWRLEVPGLPDDLTAPHRSVDQVGVRLTTLPGAGQLEASARMSGGGAYASVDADLAAWYPVGPFTLEGGTRLQSFNEFSARSLRAGVALSDTLLVPFTIRGFWGSGDRGFGVPRIGAADSVGFDALGGALDLELGPFRLSGRVSKQRIDRPLGFGAAFDALVALDSAEVDMTAWEARVDLPLIPLGAILPGVEPIRLRGFWRQNSLSGAQPLYVPADLARGELSLHDTFFDENLEIWLSGFLERRGQRAVPVAGETDPVLLGGDTWPGGQFMFRIGDFRFFWRFTNPQGSIVADIQGANLPARINLFGIRWEFFN